jgi:hypothetical protein
MTLGNKWISSVQGHEYDLKPQHRPSKGDLWLKWNIGAIMISCTLGMVLKALRIIR